MQKLCSHSQNDLVHLRKEMSCKSVTQRDLCNGCTHTRDRSISQHVSLPSFSEIHQTSHNGRSRKSGAASTSLLDRFVLWPLFSLLRSHSLTWRSEDPPMKVIFQVRQVIKAQSESIVSADCCLVPRQHASVLGGSFAGNVLLWGKSCSSGRPEQ